MCHWIHSLDAILRGEATRPEAVRDGSFTVPVGGLTVLIMLLGATYGVCMACFAVFNRPDPQYLQLLSSAAKVPALFLLTLAVTLPSLYVFNALMGSRLTAGAILRLLMASLGVALAVLASLGPIVAFFSFTTSSYPFMKLLNVAVFAFSGAAGLRFTMKTLFLLTRRSDPEDEDEVSDRSVRLVFATWVAVFGLVGAQMSWVLRPFLGDPDKPFEWFRPRESNFFEAVKSTFAALWP
jgi:hypothetical protein